MTSYYLYNRMINSSLIKAPKVHLIKQLHKYATFACRQLQHARTSSGSCYPCNSGSSYFQQLSHYGDCNPRRDTQKCERRKKKNPISVPFSTQLLSGLSSFHQNYRPFTTPDVTVDLCRGRHCCNCSSTNDEQISGGWEDMFSATVCQNLHCVQLYQPQCDPSGKRRHTITEY